MTSKDSVYIFFASFFVIIIHLLKHKLKKKSYAPMHLHFAQDNKRLSASHSLMFISGHTKVISSFPWLMINELKTRRKKTNPKQFHFIHFFFWGRKTNTKCTRRLKHFHWNPLFITSNKWEFKLIKVWASELNRAIMKMIHSSHVSHNSIEWGLLYTNANDTTPTIVKCAIFAVAAVAVVGGDDDI